MENLHEEMDDVHECNVHLCKRGRGEHTQKKMKAEAETLSGVDYIPPALIRIMTQRSARTLLDNEGRKRA